MQNMSLHTCATLFEWKCEPSNVLYLFECIWWHSTYRQVKYWINIIWIELLIMILAVRCNRTRACTIWILQYIRNSIYVQTNGIRKWIDKRTAVGKRCIEFFKNSTISMCCFAEIEKHQRSVYIFLVKQAEYATQSIKLYYRISVFYIKAWTIFKWCCLFARAIM